MNPSPKAFPIPARPVPGPAAARAWQAQRLLHAPHRLAFAAASLVMALGALWWALALLARLAPALAVLPWAVSPTLAHALLATYGCMPLFIVGFLFTAGPKWLGVEGPSARELAPALAAMVAGWGLFLAGVHLSAPLAAAGLALVALGWSALTLRFARLWRASLARDRMHAGVVLLGCVAGALGLWGAAAAVLADRVDAGLVAASLGLWCFLGPVYVAVAHRMIPFFTAAALPALDAWRPMWLLWTLLAVLLAQPLLAGLARFAPQAAAALQLAVDVPAAALLLWLAWRWGLVQSLRVRLLAMLHLGFLWFGIGLALSAVSAALGLVGDGTLTLGLAPLHAITMGFLGSVLLAMVARVSAGHSGRSLAADGGVWGLFWLFQIAVLLRIAAALWLPLTMELAAAAALAWALVATAWAVRYIGWYGRPRADGRPG